MKVLHCTDLHIRERDIAEIDQCLQAIVSTAQQEQPDLIVIAGDIFDSRDVKVDSQSAITAIGFVSALMDISPVVIVRGTPSHDGDAPKIMQYARGTYPVRVASMPEQVILSGGEFKTEEDNEGFGLSPDAIITLIPQPTKQFFQTGAGIEGGDKEIGQAMSGLFAGFGASAAAYARVPHILVGHWQVSGATMSNGQTATGRDIEVSVDQMMLANPDLICLGHIHYPQRIGDRTFYAGSPWRTNWGEMEEKGFYVHEFPRTPMGVFESRFIPTPCKRTLRLKDDFTVVDNEERGGRTYRQLLGADLRGVSIRYDVKVYQDEAETIDIEASKRNFIEQGAEEVDIRIVRVPRENVRAEAVLKAETLRDKLVALARHRGEEVPESVLVKADRLESMSIDELLVYETRGAA